MHDFSLVHFSLLRPNLSGIAVINKEYQMKDVNYNKICIKESLIEGLSFNQH